MTRSALYFTSYIHKHDTAYNTTDRANSIHPSIHPSIPSILNPLWAGPAANAPKRNNSSVKICVYKWCGHARCLDGCVPATPPTSTSISASESPSFKRSHHHHHFFEGMSVSPYLLLPPFLSFFYFPLLFKDRACVCFFVNGERDPSPAPGVPLSSLARGAGGKERSERFGFCYYYYYYYHYTIFFLPSFLPSPPPSQVQINNHQNHHTN